MEIRARVIAEDREDARVAARRDALWDGTHSPLLPLGAETIHTGGAGCLQGRFAPKFHQRVFRHAVADDQEILQSRSSLLLRFNICI